MEMHSSHGVLAVRRADHGPIATLPLWPAWVDNALCAEIDTEIFFPTKGGTTAPARAICARCTVAAECLDFAMELEQEGARIGIFGGTSPKQRRALHRLHQRQEVDDVVCWLPGYTPEALAAQIAREADFETFFAEAPALHPNAAKITGVVCGVRIEAIEDPLMRKIRYLDKLVDELAKGRPMERILRT